MHAGLAELRGRRSGSSSTCAPEKLALKQSIFADSGRAWRAPRCAASNSSSFPISDIGRGLRRAGASGLHSFMPGILPAVEVIRADATDPQVWEDAAALMPLPRQGPVGEKDIPGFLANRLQHAMIQAFR